jgi:hypothetical protein
LRPQTIDLKWLAVYYSNVPEGTAALFHSMGFATPENSTRIPHRLFMLKIYESLS